jgi:hypothetical protein
MRAQSAAAAVDPPPDTGEGRWLEQPVLGNLRPWLASYGRNAPAFRIGWLAGRAQPGQPAHTARCPFPRGSMSAAAWRASRAFQKELAE